MEKLRMLGIKLYMPGTLIMRQFLKNEITTAKLTESELDLVLEAWDTRNVVPIKLLLDYPCKVDTVRPLISPEEVELGLYSEEEYKRVYVEQIEKYLQITKF